MYTARFELDFGTCRVFAARVNPGTPGLVPPALMAALADGRVGRLALRCLFDANGQHATLLLPCEDDAQLEPMQSLLADVPDVDWCRDATDFDGLGAAIPPRRRWLDSSNDFHVQGLTCAKEASWLPDWALFRRLAAQAPLLHQVNIVHQPPDTEEQRALRKHLARLDLMANNAAWPAARLQAQRCIVERRLASPWLVDELLACASDAQCGEALAPLRERLLEQGGAVLAEAAAQEGDFDELLHTGLDSGRFMSHDVVAGVGRSVYAATLWAALGQPDALGQAHVTDAFISHAAVDAALAQRLCARLEAGGTRCWIAPRDIAAGRHYAEVIDDALRGSRAIVLLLSEAATESTHVLRELERAVHYRALVLPLRLADLQPRQAYSYLLSGCQWTDALPGFDEAAVVQRLLDALARGG
jgi:hypothetical protein